jgi:hypothetical protein
MAVLLIGAATVQVESQEFIETSAARRLWFDEIVDLSRPEEPVRPQVIDVPGGPAIEVRVDEQLGNRYFSFLRHSSTPAELASPGTYIVRQRRSDGAIDQIKVFLQYNEGTFVRLRPRPNRRFLALDVYLAGSEFYRDVTVPISLDRALRTPVTEIQRLTAGIVDWSVVEPDTDRSEYTAVSDMVDRIRRVLPLLTDADDGAMDADGDYVAIDSRVPIEERPGLNCSGFAKWVVDGLYRPVAGSLMPIEPLLEKHLDHRGTRWSRRLEETRDPYFGLDWTRNLARAVYALHHGSSVEDIDPEARDVRSVPVARYREDVGFSVESLSGILYWLAVNEPGMIYLGSVSRSFGDEPVLRQHSHVVVLLPHFTRDGRFRPVVMERNAETDFEQFTHRLEGEFIHLVRVDGTHPFDPPPPPR